MDSNTIATTMTYSAMVCHLRYRGRGAASRSLTVSLITDLLQRVGVHDLDRHGDALLDGGATEVLADGLDGLGAEVARLLRHVGLEGAAALDGLDRLGDGVVADDDHVAPAAPLGRGECAERRVVVDAEDALQVRVRLEHVLGRLERLVAQPAAVQRG